jgi:hypothetical protein
MEKGTAQIATVQQQFAIQPFPILIHVPSQFASCLCGWQKQNRRDAETPGKLLPPNKKAREKFPRS